MYRWTRLPCLPESLFVALPTAGSGSMFRVVLVRLRISADGFQVVPWCLIQHPMAVS